MLCVRLRQRSATGDAPNSDSEREMVEKVERTWGLLMVLPISRGRRRTSAHGNPKSGDHIMIFFGFTAND